MALDADLLVDRRRLKRRLAFWRVSVVLLALGAAVFAFERFAAPQRGAYVARLNVDDIILNDQDRVDALADLVEDSRVKALIVHVNSPGGTVVGGETLYRTLRKVAAKKPVVAVMDDLATSAGYMVAIAAERIYAHEGTITGSIGVLFQTAEITELLNKLGISVTAIKSAPLKAEPSPISKLTPEARAVTQALVDDMFAMFVDMVAERRKMDRAATLKLADGRVYTGRMALGNRLIDAIGGEREALAWLRREHGIGRRVPVRDLHIRRDFEDLLDRLAGMARKTVLSERVTLDGLVSVWHPQLN